MTLTRIFFPPLVPSPSQPHPTGDWREQLRPLVAKLKECVMEVVEKAKRAMTFVLLQEAACSIPQGLPLQQRRDVVFSQAVSSHTWFHKSDNCAVKATEQWSPITAMLGCHRPRRSLPGSDGQLTIRNLIHTHRQFWAEDQKSDLTPLPHTTMKIRAPQLMTMHFLLLFLKHWQFTVSFYFY